MTLNDLEWLFDVKIRFRPALCCRIDASFGAHCTNMNEDRPILSAAKMWANESSFWKYKVHADIRGSSSWPGRQTTLSLSTMAIFGDLGGYVFENSRDTASKCQYYMTLWRYAYAARCRPITECKMNDLERPWVAIHVKMRFWPALRASERLNVKK